MARLLALLFVLLFTQVSFAQSINSVLQQARQKQEGRLIKSGKGYNLWVQQAGQGKTKLLVLPGGPGDSHRGYEPFRQLLPQQDVQVFILDMIDCGLSDRTQNSVYWSLANFVEDVDAVRSALGWEQFFLLGHSFGGMVAFEYAAAHPDRLQGLLITNMTDSFEGLGTNIELFADSLLHQDSLGRQWQTQAQQLDPSSAAGRQTRSRLDSLKLVLMQRANVPAESAILPPLRAYFPISPDTLLDQNVALGNHLFRSEAVLSWDFSPRLANLSMPVLLLGGGRDYALRWSDMVRIKSQLQQGSLAYCPSGNHIAFWSHYACYYQPLIDFLSHRHRP
jgi:proline iminopeptidase